MTEAPIPEPTEGPGRLLPVRPQVENPPHGPATRVLPGPEHATSTRVLPAALAAVRISAGELPLVRRIDDGHGEVPGGVGAQGVLIGAVTVGVGVYTQSIDQSRSHQSDRVHATAVLLVDASDTVADQGSTAPYAGVPARWTDSVGRQHEDEVLARSDGRAGDQVSIWLDRDGDLTSPPGSPLSAALDGSVIGIAVLGLAAA